MMIDAKAIGKTEDYGDLADIPVWSAFRTRRKTKDPHCLVCLEMGLSGRHSPACPVRPHN